MNRHPARKIGANLPRKPDAAILDLARALARMMAREDHAREEIDTARAP